METSVPIAVLLAVLFAAGCATSAPAESTDELPSGQSVAKQAADATRSAEKSDEDVVRYDSSVLPDEGESAKQTPEDDGPQPEGSDDSQPEGSDDSPASAPPEPSGNKEDDDADHQASDPPPESKQPADNADQPAETNE